MSGLSVCSYESHYNQALATFQSNSNTQEEGMKWWKSNMPAVIRTASSTESFRVLAVGTATGKPYDEALLDMLCASQKHVVYTVVEPSQTAMKAFQDLVKCKYSSVEFRWFCMTWQEFQDKEWKKDGSLYNLIHFIHCIYYVSSSVEELRERIRECYVEKLNAGGVIVSYLSNRNAKRCFLHLESTSKRVVDVVKLNLIEKIAVDENWKVDAEELSYKLDLSSCFDEASVEGNLLLDCLTHVKNFRETASREEIDTMMKYLEEQLEENSRIAYPCNFDITTIWKEMLPPVN